MFRKTCFGLLQNNYLKLHVYYCICNEEIKNNNIFKLIFVFLLDGK